jgi:predicted porin
MFARGALAGAPVIPQTRANQNWHAAIEYEVPTTYVGLNYEVIDNQGTPTNTAKRLGLGASYAIAPDWRLYGAYGHETRSDNSLDLNLFSISAGWQFTPAQNLALGYFRVNDKLSGTGHGGADETSVLHRYALSKRTTIYTALSYLKQHDLRNSFSLGGAAVVEAGARPTTPVPGGSIQAVQMGINHVF